MDAASLLRGNHKKGNIILSTVSGVGTTKDELIRLFDRSIPSVDIITTKSFQVTGNLSSVLLHLVISAIPSDSGIRVWMLSFPR